MQHEPMYRILDANLNRVREELRVVEEYLRFVREDPRGAWRLKSWRHRLREMIDALGPEALLRARAADADVGKDFPSPSQSAKLDPVSITIAGLKRLQESLRAIEEYAAAINSAVSRTAGGMRFEIYQYEKELFLTGPRARFESVRLYLLVGSDQVPPEAMPDRAKEWLEAGVDCFQLREKQLKDRDLMALAQKLADVCRQAGKLFIVNDRPDIARAVGADGVHVGQDDLPVPTVRHLLGSDRIIGISTHNPDQLREALELDPAYVAVGPAFDTATKPHEPTAGPGYIADAVRQLREAGIPEVAIGGITPENLPQLQTLGVRRIAVCGAILSTPDPVTAVRRFASLLHP